jgi:hypothetical protein
MLQDALAMLLPWEVVGPDKMSGMLLSLLAVENVELERGVGNGKLWVIICS